MPTKTLLYRTASLALLLPAVVHAGFQVDTKTTTPTIPAPKAQTEQAAPTKVETVRRVKPLEAGTRPANIPHIDGFGNDLTLVEAVKQIAPAGWKGFTVGTVDANRKVSWRSPTSQQWHLVLRDLLVRNQLWATVNWDEQTITIMPMMDALESVPANDAAANSLPRPSSTNAASEKPPVPAPLVREWTLAAGRSLQTNLEEWGAKAGWRVIWKPDFRYVVAVPATLKGEFEGPDGVVAQVVNAYRSADRPIISEFFRGNKVVEIREAPANYASK